MVNTSHDKESLMALMEKIKDPEIPVLSIVDLGIVRDVQFENNQPVITITSTYNGCPAMDLITIQIMVLMRSAGFENPQVKMSLHPAWTTEWINESAKKRLQEYGIAPPDKRFSIPVDGVECPRCHSVSTRLISEFGSTACKALYQCNDCKEPFDFFKCH